MSEASPHAAQLVIVPMRLTTEQGETLQLKSDGTLLLHSQGKVRFLGNVTTAGELVGPGSKRLVALQQDGTLLRHDGVTLPIRLLVDGTAISAQQVIKFNDSGALESDSANTPNIRTEGVTKKSRRTAMFLLILAAFPVGY